MLVYVCVCVYIYVCVCERDNLRERERTGEERHVERKELQSNNRLKNVFHLVYDMR